MGAIRKVACIGECMVELRPAQDDCYRLGFAGDTFNTAAYMARQFGDELEVSFISGIGDDPQSLSMIEQFKSEAIKVDDLQFVSGRQPGLYLIENDDQGERYFQYWRSQSAARYMFDGHSIEQIVAILKPFDLVYLSGITLAILDEKQRQSLYSALTTVKGSIQIGFDPNYRAALWPNKQECVESYQKMAALSSYALVTLDDHQALWDSSATSEQVAKIWKMWGAEEVVVKNGSEQCILLDQEGISKLSPRQTLHPVDTTGAGDSFSAGYLGARLTGLSNVRAASLGHAIASQVIMNIGGVIDMAKWKKVEPSEYA